MTVEQLTEVDILLLGRWSDVVGIREAIKELEGRLGDRLEEENPYVWLMSDGLDEDEQAMFQVEVSSRVKDRPGGWLNEECKQDSPVGRYITSHGDVERARLAQSDDSLESFIRTQLDSIFPLGDDFDAALQTVRNAKPPKAKG